MRPHLKWRSFFVWRLILVFNGGGPNIRIGVLTALLLLAALGAWLFNSQARVDAAQDKKIEKRVEKQQYYFDIRRIFDKLDEIGRDVKK